MNFASESKFRGAIKYQRIKKNSINSFSFFLLTLRAGTRNHSSLAEMRIYTYMCSPWTTYLEQKENTRHYKFVPNTTHSINAVNIYFHKSLYRDSRWPAASK